MAEQTTGKTYQDRIPPVIKETNAEIAQFIISNMRYRGGGWSLDMSTMQPGGPVVSAREGRKAEVTGNQRLQMTMAALKLNIIDSRWVTYEEATQLGWQVRRNQHPFPVEMWTSDHKRCYNQNLFNAYQCAHSGPTTGMPQNMDPEDAEAVDKLIDDLLKSVRCHVYMGADRVQYFEQENHGESFAVMPDIDDYPSKLDALSDIIRIAAEESYNFKLARDRGTADEGKKIDYGLACELAALFMAQDLGAPFGAGAPNVRDYEGIAKAIEEIPTRLSRAANAAEKAAGFGMTVLKRHQDQKETVHDDTVRGAGHDLDHVWEFKRYVPKQVCDKLDEKGIDRSRMSTPETETEPDSEKAHDAFMSYWPIVNVDTGDVYIRLGYLEAEHRIISEPDCLAAIGAGFQGIPSLDELRCMSVLVESGEGVSDSRVPMESGWKLCRDESIFETLTRAEEMRKIMEEMHEGAARAREAATQAAPVREARSTEQARTEAAREVEPPSAEAGARGREDMASAAQARDGMAVADPGGNGVEANREPTAPAWAPAGMEADAPQPAADPARAAEARKLMDSIAASFASPTAAPSRASAPSRPQPQRGEQMQLPWEVLQPWQKASVNDMGPAFVAPPSEAAPTPAPEQAAPVQAPEAAPGGEQVQGAPQVPQEAPASARPAPAPQPSAPVEQSAPQTERESVQAPQPTTDAASQPAPAVEQPQPSEPAPQPVQHEAAQGAPAPAPQAEPYTRAPEPKQAPEQAPAGRPRSILTAPNTPEFNASASWYRDKKDAIDGICAGRVGPACWGQQFTLPGGQAITPKEFLGAFDNKPLEAQRFIMLACTGEIGGGPVPWEDAASALRSATTSKEVAAACTELLKGTDGSPLKLCPIEPSDFDQAGLAALYEARPDLFDDRHCDVHPELAEVRDAMEDRYANEPSWSEADLPWAPSSRGGVDR